MQVQGREAHRSGIPKHGVVLARMYQSADTEERDTIRKMTAGRKKRMSWSATTAKSRDMKYQIAGRKKERREIEERGQELVETTENSIGTLANQ